MLVVSAGDVGTAMIKAGLDEGLVPYTEVDLTDPDRPIIDDAFLSDTPSASLRRAKFQSVVLPSEAPSGLSAAEKDALTRFEREFKVRQLDAYVYPSPSVGLSYPVSGDYSGALDGMVATVSDAAKSQGFSYLAGDLTFDDLEPGTLETYGYLARPLPPDPEGRWSFTPLLSAPMPASGDPGVLMGVYRIDGREELVLTATMNQYQLIQQTLFPGILSWLTYGVHLGTERNYLAVHIDDVFLADARWHMEENCTVEDDCRPELTAPGILMTPEDVDYLVAWQQRQGLKLDIVYNGDGYDATLAEHGSFPLGARLLQHKQALRWINHTYTHLYLGCIQDYRVSPWECVTDGTGQVAWTPYETVYRELNENILFAQRLGISIAPGELVTGEHSGLRRTPQEPSDNPHLLRALTDLRFTWVGSDNSREIVQRPVGGALTVPRYPMNIFYNVGTKAEEVDEYNWIYTSKADGGSGICEIDPSSTCIEPLDLSADFDAYIVPQEARTTLLHMVSNSPRPHYAHQSNLAEDRILYPVLDAALESYRRVFAANTPFVNPTLTQAGTELRQRAAWSSARAGVSAYVQGGVLFVTAPSTTQVPLSAPSGSLGGTLSSYGGARTGWQSVAPTGRLILLPSSVQYAR